MNFNSNIQIVKGGEIPNNSVALLYSPTCGYCHQMIPQFNELPNALRAGGLSDVQVVAVDIQQEFHSLRAGGIQVMGVPHVIIKTVQGGLIDYNGPRMADSIAQEAARVLNGGETKLLNGGAQEDALLGGSTPVVDATATTPSVTGGSTDLEGGKKRRRKSKSRSRSRKHRKMHGGEQVQGGEADLEGGKKRRRKSKSRSRSRKHRKMHGGETAEVKVEGGATETTTEAVAVTGGSTDLEGGKKRRRKSKSRSRSRKHRKMHGGEQVQGGEADLEGGKKRRRKSKSRSRSRKHRKMHGGESEVKVEGGAVAVQGGATETTTTEASPAPVAVTGGSTDLEGGKKRRRKSKSRSRSRKHRKMHGGDAETAVQGGEADLEGGKKRRRKSKSRSRSRKHRKMHGGETETPVQGGEDAAAIEGGKRRRKSRSKSRSKSRWMATVMKLYNTGKYKTLGAAMKSAKRIYRG